MTMLGVRLEPELEERLERLAKQTGHTKSYHAKKAISNYIEDREDYLLAVAALERLESGKAQTVSLENLVKKYALENRVFDGRNKTARPVRPRRAKKNSQVRGTKTSRAA
jgi:RHH-type rel operon transcriptional repressor/antitoxin RelB